MSLLAVDFCEVIPYDYEWFEGIKPPKLNCAEGSIGVFRRTERNRDTDRS